MRVSAVVIGSVDLFVRCQMTDETPTTGSILWQTNGIIDQRMIWDLRQTKIVPKMIRLWTSTTTILSKSKIQSELVHIFLEIIFCTIIVNEEKWACVWKGYSFSIEPKLISAMVCRSKGTLFTGLGNRAIFFF